MQEDVRGVVERLFRAAEAADIRAALGCFAENGMLIDPHYPNPEMRGRAEIEKGLVWGLSVMKQFGFRIARVFEGADGRSAAFEIDTNHVLKGGQKLSFPQVFVVDVKDGLIVSMRAYEPHGPNGIGGFFLGLERLKRRFSR